MVFNKLFPKLAFACLAAATGSVSHTPFPPARGHHSSRDDGGEGGVAEELMRQTGTLTLGLTLPLFLRALGHGVGNTFIRPMASSAVERWRLQLLPAERWG